MSECKACGEEMRWAKTAAGKSIPLDPDPTSAGNIVLEDGVAVVLPDPAKYDGEKYTSHFATCPDAKKFRR